MDLFEYQGKQYFARYGIPVSAGDVATTVHDAVRPRRATIRHCMGERSCASSTRTCAYPDARSSRPAISRSRPSTEAISARLSAPHGTPRTPARTSETP